MSILKYFKTSGGATPTHPQSDASEIAAGNRLTIPQPHSDECALSLVPVQLPPTAIDTCSDVDSGEPESYINKCTSDDQSTAASTQRVLPLTPNQPKLKFPTRTFGSQKRGFCATWYQNYPWLHYIQEDDSVLCFYCATAVQNRMPVTGYIDSLFSTTGFNNWQKTIAKFNKHAQSASHRHAVDMAAMVSKPSMDVNNLIAYLKSLNAVERTLYLEVFELAKLILVMPANNAISERSFSTLRRLKTWLRNTINQNRLNWCMVLYIHVHKTETDLLDLKQIGNEFISHNSSRGQHIFGRFV